jgi:hypothetical protein
MKTDSDFGPKSDANEEQFFYTLLLLIFGEVGVAGTTV